MSFEQAVIFAGGRGERLRPLTDMIPKPMAPVNGRPFVDYLLRMLRDAGIRRVVFLLGYKAESVIDHYRKQSIPGLEIDYSIGKEEDQTGRRLINAYEKLEDKFLLLYGDNYWPAPLEKMKKNFEHLQVPLMTTVFSNKKGTGEYGFGNNVMVDPSGRVKAYDKSRRLSGLNGVDIGFFLIDKNIIDPNENGNISFEEVILAKIASEGKLGAFLTDEQYYYITSFDNLQRFEQIIRQKVIPGRIE
ncbi:MAG: NTP transferase domain-containing protein [Candidatus Omnitrophica bacterium]|nr:NTP transferase domain-containing protein [Candidatus Omnitrophota bacterium]